MNISEEIIDSFVRGDLSGADLETFTHALAADPKLQQEVSFQKDIIESLQKHRHQQLKSRLNAIEVKPAGGLFASAYIKLAASIGVVALLSGSFALFNKNTSPTIVATENTVRDTDNSINTISEESQSTVSEPIIDNVAENTVVQNKKTDNAVPENNTKLKNKKKSDNTASYSELSDKEMNEDYTIDHVNDEVNMPVMNDGSASISAPQVKVSIVKEDNNLGYRFFNNQLFLHGNFSNSTYELFELNNKPSKQLFLYFENNYYELIQGKTKITALTPITDKATLFQLTQLREH